MIGKGARSVHTNRSLNRRSRGSRDEQSEKRGGARLREGVPEADEENDGRADDAQFVQAGRVQRILRTGHARSLSLSPLAPSLRTSAGVRALIRRAAKRSGTVEPLHDSFFRGSKNGHLVERICEPVKRFAALLMSPDSPVRGCSPAGVCCNQPSRPPAERGCISSSRSSVRHSSPTQAPLSWLSFFSLARSLSPFPSSRLCGGHPQRTKIVTTAFEFRPCVKSGVRCRGETAGRH